MNKFIQELKQYLSEVTGMRVSVEVLEAKGLPYFLARQYSFYQLVMGKIKWVAVFLRQKEEFKPVQFLKHMSQVSFVDLNQLCLVTQILPSYVRKRLIEKKISFVIPRVQMYLPRMGMELRPSYGIKENLPVNHLSPAAQMLLIFALLKRIKQPVTPLEMSKKLQYSAMSMSRAFDQLEASKIASIKKAGKERLISFDKEIKELWQRALPYLRSPIKHSLHIFKKDIGRRKFQFAGKSALAKYSMLNEPNVPEYAISREAWKDLKNAGIEQIPVEDSKTCLIQVWSYDPNILKVDQQVDPFSLYLSLKDETDERIQMALETMLESYL